MPFVESKSIFIHVPKCAGISVTASLFGCRAGGHASAAEYLAVFGSGWFDKAFKFTIVRNPWDRVLSAYHFLRSGGLTAQDKDWSRDHIDRYEEFDDFVYRGLPLPSVRRGIHFRPQVEFLRDPRDGSLCVDYLGRIETLERDFDQIASRLNIQVELPRLNTQDRSIEFQSHYSDRARSIVAHLYHDDIATFGYRFS